MQPVYIQSESTVCPSEIEVGVTTVYLRKNIFETQRADLPGDGTMYVYEEAQMSKDEAVAALYEASLAQREITAAQDDALIELYEMLGGEI